MPAFQKLSERTEKDKHCSVHSNSRITLIVHRATMRKMVQSRVSTRKFCIILNLKYLLDHRQSSINSLRYADDTTLKAESEEELKSLLMRLKRQSEKPGLKFNIFKTKIMASGPISSWQIKGEEVEAVTDFTFLGSKINVEGDYSHEIKRCLLLGRKAMTKLVQFSSVTQSCLTLCDPMNREARQASLSITNSRNSPKPMSIELMMPSNHPILCRPLLLLPSIFPSFMVFSNESALHIRWPKYWSFSFSISPSNEHPGLMSFRMDWLDLLAVQGTLKSLLQHHSSKASILCAQLSL